MPSKWIFVVIATFALFERGHFLSCICHEDSPLTPDDWRAQNCPTNVQCPPDSQVIWDICYCCKSSCSKLEGEPCGGAFGETGVCGEGLECYIEQPDNSDYYEFDGKCVLIKPTATTKSPSGSTTESVPSNAAGGAATTKPLQRMRCGKKKMALMGEEQREKCEEERRMRIQMRRERNGKQNTMPRV